MTARSLRAFSTPAFGVPELSKSENQNPKFRDSLRKIIFYREFAQVFEIS
jgi:hypothetical protein